MKIFAIVIGIILIAGTAIYGYLGGFKQPDIKKTELPEYIIVGKFYQGRSSDEQLGNIYYEIKTRHDKKELNGVLTAVYYQINSKVKDSTQVFLGIAVEDTLRSLPPGYEYRKFTKKPGIRATITCNPYVMPRPETMQVKIEEFAKNISLKPASYVMEKYISADTFEVEVPVK
jgi:hypothetical protein